VERKVTSGIMLAFLIIGMLMLASSIQRVKSEPRTWTVDDDGQADFSSIQDAIKAASPGDTVHVKAGTYFENVVVNIAISLVGENKRTTIIDGNTTGTVVYVTVGNVTIRNFTIRNGAIGIQLYFTLGLVTLKENNITNNKLNFWVEGHDQADFMHQIDTSNTVDGKPVYYLVNKHNEEIANEAGYVAVINSTNISVKGLNLMRNGQGILFAFSDNSAIENVNVKNSTYGVFLRRCNKVLVKNSVLENNNYGIYIYKNRNTTIAGNVIVNNTLTGIFMEDYSKHNLFEENTISSNKVGIEFMTSVENVFRHNTLSKNGYGFSIYSSDNRIYLNNFINNTVQVKADFGLFTTARVNIWDDGYPSGGNYWSDYTGVDDKSGPNQDQAGSDGIGDAPYTIDANNKDRYPLMTILDVIAPRISIIFPLNRSEIKSSTIAASWIGSDEASGISHYEIRLDSGSWINVETNTTYAFIGLNDGSHTIEVKAIDNAGNTKQIKVSFTVNTSPLFGPGYMEEAVVTATIIILILGVALYLLKIRKSSFNQ